MKVKMKVPVLIAVLSLLVLLLTGWKTLGVGIDLLAVVPWLDQWVTVFKQLSESGLSLNDLFVQHNEHRIPLTLLIDVADMKFCGGEGWLEFIITTLSMLAMSWAIWSAFVQGRNGLTPVQLTSFFIVASLFFCVSQVEVWFWPFIVGNVLSNTFTVLALCILPFAIYSKSRLLLCLSIISSSLAVFGLASGVLVWPLGFLIIVILERDLTLNLVLWCLAGSLVLGLYFHGFVRPSYHANPIDSILNSPKDFLLFVVFLMGAPMAYFGKLGALVLGSAILGFGIYVIVTVVWSVFKRSAPLAPGYFAMAAVILFSFGCAFAVAGSRLNFGFDHAFSSRYTTIPIIALAALHGIGFIQIKHRLLAYQVGWLVLLFLLLISYPSDIGLIRAISGTLKTAGIAMVLKINDQDVFSKITPASERVPEAGEFLEKRNLSVFRGKQYPVDVLLSHVGRQAYPPRCSGGIEKSESMSTDSKAIRLTGWARMDGSPHIPERIVFVEKATDKVIGWAEPGGASAPIEGLMEGTVNKKRWVGYAKTTNVDGVRIYALDSKSREFCLLE